MEQAVGLSNRDNSRKSEPHPLFPAGEKVARASGPYRDMGRMPMPRKTTGWKPVPHVPHGAGWKPALPVAAAPFDAPFKAGGWLEAAVIMAGARATGAVRVARVARAAKVVLAAGGVADSTGGDWWRLVAI